MLIVLICFSIYAPSDPDITSCPRFNQLAVAHDLPKQINQNQNHTQTITIPSFLFLSFFVCSLVLCARARIECCNKAPVYVPGKLFRREGSVACLGFGDEMGTRNAKDIMRPALATRKVCSNKLPF